MINAYIEDRNFIKYEFKKLTRRQKIETTKLVQKIGHDFEGLEEIAFKLLQYNYPELTKEKYEDILDYNVERYGFNELYEMLGYIINDVFSQVGGEAKEVHPYLQKKREEKKESSETQEA